MHLEKIIWSSKSQVLRSAKVGCPTVASRHEALLKGRLTQEEFAEHIGMSLKGLERILSSSRGLSRRSAARIFNGLATIVRSRQFTKRDVNFVRRARGIIGSPREDHRSESFEARHALIASLVRAGIVRSEDVPDALEILSDMWAYGEEAFDDPEFSGSEFERCRSIALAAASKNSETYQRLVEYFEDELDYPEFVDPSAP